MRRFAFRIAFLIAFFSIGSIDCSAQAKQPPKGMPAAAADYKASPAFAEVRLRKAELESEIESMLVEYTDDFPKVKEARATLALLQKEIDRLANAASSSVPRFSLALGRLMLRKVEVEAEFQRLSESFQPNHPDVKRAKRKVDSFEAAIKEIIGQ